MCNYGLKSCVILLRKIKPTVILLSLCHTSTKNSSCFHFQKILRKELVKRDFCINVKVQNTSSIIKKVDQDSIDNEKLEELLKDSNNARTYKLLKYELEYMKQLEESLPSNLRPKDFIELMNLPTITQRRKYLRFLFLNEMKAITAKQKKSIAKEESRNKLLKTQELCPSGLEYGLGKNTLFLRFYDKTMDHFFNYKAMLSMLFEPKIVLDCGYDESMNKHEISNCAKQILISIILNRTHNTPAHLYLCNADKNSRLLIKLKQLMPTIYTDSYPLDITPKSYTEIFDKRKLVYLTPHCKKEMKFYDPDKIYIIGALVDKRDPQWYSLAKAKKEGIHMEQFPLDTYLQWNTGSGKSLTLNQVTGVLLDMKYKKDWLYAFKNHVPRRKVMQIKEKINKNNHL